MARVMVVADDGWVALDELVRTHDFGSELFRRHLAERLAWAVADAEAEPEDRPAPAGERPALAATP